MRCLGLPGRFARIVCVHGYAPDSGAFEIALGIGTSRKRARNGYARGFDARLGFCAEKGDLPC